MRVFGGDVAIALSAVSIEFSENALFHHSLALCLSVSLPLSLSLSLPTYLSLMHPSLSLFLFSCPCHSQLVIPACSPPYSNYAQQKALHRRYQAINAKMTSNRRRHVVCGCECPFACVLYTTLIVVSTKSFITIAFPIFLNTHIMHALFFNIFYSPLCISSFFLHASHFRLVPTLFVRTRCTDLL